MLPGMKWKKRIHCSLLTGAQQTQCVSKNILSYGRGRHVDELWELQSRGQLEEAPGMK